MGSRGGLNLYGYGAGDPINNSDPFGLSPVVCLINPMGCVAAVVGAVRVGVGLYRAAQAYSSMMNDVSEDLESTLATKSHTVGRTRNGPQLEVHWEEPTSSGDPGNVHFQGVGPDKHNFGKVFVTNANDPTQLPRALRANSELRRLLRRAQEQLRKFREQNPPGEGTQPPPSNP